MPLIYAVHILAGSIGLITGYVALYAAKGAPLHRRVGMAFVVSMLTMCGFGIVIALVRWRAPGVNVPAGIMAAYLVITALTTVRPAFPGTRRFHAGLMLVALAVGTVELVFAVQAIRNGGTRYGMPAFPFVLFGLVGVLGGIGDARMLRSGPPVGARRISRHLWRMTFALFIAAMSFFFGQAKVIPRPIRIMPLLALPVVAVFLTLIYWLWRVRIRHSIRGLALQARSVAP